MLVRESITSFRRGIDPKVSLDIGTLARALGWLKANRKIENNWRTDNKDKPNYNFRVDSKTDDIILTGLKLEDIKQLEIPEYIIKLLTPRMQFNIGIIANEKYSKYATKAIDKGYLPSASFIYDRFLFIDKILGKDRFLKVLIDKFGNYLKSNLTQYANYVWNNQTLRQYFDNVEFKYDENLRDRGYDIIEKDRAKALKILTPYFKETTSPRQRKNQTIQVSNNRGTYILTKGGRLRIASAKSGIYTNDNTTFEEMAKIVISKIGINLITESTIHFKRGQDSKKGLDVGTRSSYFWPKEYEELTEEEKEPALFNYREYFIGVDGALDNILGDEFLLEPLHNQLVQVFGSNPYDKIKGEPMISFDPGNLYFDIYQKSINLKNSIKINDGFAFLKFLGLSDSLIEEIWYEIGENYIEFEPNDFNYKFSPSDEDEIKNAEGIFDKYINDLMTRISDQYDYMISEENLIEEMKAMETKFNANLEIEF